jgi:hypothetical protein
MQVIRGYTILRVEQLRQVLLIDLFLLLVKMEAVEDEEEAKLRVEAEKIDILAAVNTDANVLPRLAPALVPAAVDMPSI